MYLIFQQWQNGTYHAAGTQVNYAITPVNGSFSWEATTQVKITVFRGNSGVCATLQEAETACENDYMTIWGLAPQPSPPQPQFVSTIPHVSGPMPGVNPYAQPYRLNRTNDWMPAENYWSALLNVPINAPKPDLNQYLWNPNYSWFTDYGIDPNQPIPSPQPRPA